MIRFQANTAIAGALALVLCAACTRAPAPAAANAIPPPAVVAPPARGPDVQTRYACDDGNYVDVLREGSVRIAMSDGRSVALGKVENSVPPTWQDVGLTFTASDAGATLDQNDGKRSLSCKPQDQAPG